jgi:DNA recombination protein RmuC
MTNLNIYLLIGLVLLNLGLIIAFFRRRNPVDPETFRPLLDETRRVETSLRDEFTRARGESTRDALALREEVGHRISSGLETLLNRQGEAQLRSEQTIEGLHLSMENRLREFGDASDSRSTRLRQELNEGSLQARNEMRQVFVEFRTAVQTALGDSGKAQGTQLADFAQRLDKLNEALGQQLDKIRLTVEGKLTELQTRNEQKLEEMRKTVDEKLEGTLERRLGESFKLVSERLEQVHKGLGEMQVMASSVGDLKRVLTNVKTRGTWGEIQLGALLEQVLTPDQYGANIAPKPDSSERVEFAIRLPGKNGSADAPLWLPIDAKFPQEDYQRVVEASDAGDAEGLALASKALEMRLRGQAKDIQEKYIAPPHTTDFAILFLPSESLYAEALRRPGLSEKLQVENRVVLAGPTTLAALLNSLQMGFKTLAIQERSSEVWRVLAAVKGEFGKFGDVLAKVKKKIDEASSQIEQTERRTRVINRTLRDVEALPTDTATPLISASPLVPEELIEPENEPIDPEIPLLARKRTDI